MNSSQEGSSTSTDLRLAVQQTVSSRAFEIQFIIENETSSAQTRAIRVLERTISTNTGTRRSAWGDRYDIGVSLVRQATHFFTHETMTYPKLL